MAYIGNWPTTVGFNAVNFKAISDTKQTISQSGRRVRVSVAGTRFQATIQYPNMPVNLWRPIQAVAVRAEGPLNSFDITLPKVSENQSGTSGTTAIIVGTNVAGSSSVNISTNKNSTLILAAGDVIRFPGHNKVYMVTANVTTDGSGDATVNITPNLISAEVADGSSAVVLDDVPFRMTLNGDVQQFKHAVDGTITYEIEVLEEV